MNKISILLLAFIFIAAQALYAKDSAVIKLTTTNFNQVKTGNWLVQFYAEWCPHCKYFVRTYQEVAQKLNKEGKVKVAAIDAFRYKTFVKIYGYPQVKLFINGKIYDYYGPRKTNSIVKFVNDQLKKHAPKLKKDQ